MDEVLELDSIGLNMCQESFVRPTAASFEAMVEMMSAQASTSASGVYGGVFVLTPYSFAMICHQDSFILFDSHCHSTLGALLAAVPIEHSVAYIQDFSPFLPCFED